MTRIAIITAPYHDGLRDVGVGRGPRRLLEAGLRDALHGLGMETRVVEIAPVDPAQGRSARSFAVMRGVAAAVRAAGTAGDFPLVLAGNCNATVGVHAGVGNEGMDIVWFDAHPDFDTPDVSHGYFDGMGVAILTGQCWQQLAVTIPGFSAVDPARLTYCGIRDFEPGQREEVAACGIARVEGSCTQRVDFAARLRSRLAAGAGASVLVHLDLDCLDTAVGHANAYAAPGGLSADDLAACMRALAQLRRPVAMTIASFDPHFAGSDRIAAAALDAARIIATTALPKAPVRT